MKVPSVSTILLKGKGFALGTLVKVPWINTLPTYRCSTYTCIGRYSCEKANAPATTTTKNRSSIPWSLLDISFNGWNARCRLHKGLKWPYNHYKSASMLLITWLQIGARLSKNIMIFALILVFLHYSSVTFILSFQMILIWNSLFVLCTVIFHKRILYSFWWENRPVDACQEYPIAM